MCGADAFVFRMRMPSVPRLEERLAQVEDGIMRIIAEGPGPQAMMLRPAALHGVGKVTALSPIREACDSTRLKDGSAFASYIGLVPSEASTGSSIARGGMAKKGDSRLRRVIVEAASCHPKPLGLLRGEDAGVPEAVRAKAERRRRRLHERRAAPKGRGVNDNKTRRPSRVGPASGSATSR